MTELDLDRVGERLRVVRLRVDRNQRFGGAQVLRIELEDLFVRLRSAIVLLLLVRPELGDLEEEADLRLGVRLLRLLLLEDADELVPLAGLGVEDLEVVPAAEREVLLLERFLRFAIVRVELEERAPRGDGAFVVVEAVAVDRAELREDLDLLRRVVRDLGPSLEHADELVERLGALVESGESAQGFGVLRVALDDLFPEVDADLRLLHTLGCELRDLEELLRALVTRRESLGFAALQPQELLPVAPLLVHLTEVVDRRRVLGLDGEHELERLHGLGLIRELVHVQVRRAHVEPDLLVRIRNHARELEQRLDELVEALRRLLLVGEGAEFRDLPFVDARRLRRRRLDHARRRGGRRRLRGRRFDDGDGGRAVRDGRRRRRGCRGRRRGDRRGAIRRLRLDASSHRKRRHLADARRRRFAHARHRRVADARLARARLRWSVADARRRRLAHARQRRRFAHAPTRRSFQRGRRNRAARMRHDHVVLAGVGQLERRLARRREDLLGHLHGARRRARRREQRRSDSGCVFQVLANLRFEREELRVLGRHDREALEAGAGAHQVAHLPPRDDARLREHERRVAVFARARRGLFGEREHAIPVAAFATVSLPQIVEGPFVFRVESKRLFEEARSDFDVLVPRDPARAKQHRHRRARGRILDPGQDRLLQTLERIERAGLGAEPFEERRRVLRRRIGRVRFREQRLDFIGREALREPRRAEQDAPLRCAARLIGLGEELLDARLPGVAPGLHVFETRCRVGARAPRSPHRTGVGGRRFVVVADVLQHVAEFEEELSPLRAVLLGLQFELEQLLHHRELAEGPVDAPCSLETFQERRVQLERVLEVLERLRPLKELRLENLPEAQVIRRLRRTRGAACNALLELFDETLPIAEALQQRKTILKFHGSSRSIQPVER